MEEIAGSLRAELTLQAEQHLNHFLQQEQACFTSYLRNVESHLQAEVANTRFHLQQEYLARTFEVEERAAASENAYAQYAQGAPGAEESAPGENQAQLMGEVFTSKANTLSMCSNSGESCKKLNTKGCWTQNLAQPLGRSSKG